MFWSKTKPPERAENTIKPVSISSTPVSRANHIAELENRRKMLDWRDKFTANIELHLSRELGALLQSVEDLLVNSSMIDTVFKRKGYVASHIEPLYQDWLEREVGIVLEQARLEFRSLYNVEEPSPEPEFGVTNVLVSVGAYKLLRFKAPTFGSLTDHIKENMRVQILGDSDETKSYVAQAIRTHLDSIANKELQENEQL